jgi:hypothetical protein
MDNATALAKVGGPYHHPSRGYWFVRIFERKTRLTKWSKPHDIVCRSKEEAEILLHKKKIEFNIVLAPAAAGGGGAPGGAGAAAGGADDGEQEDQHEEAMEVVEEHHAEGGGGGGGAPGGELHQGEPEPHQGEPHVEAQLEEEPPYHRPALSHHQKYDPSWQYVRSIKVVDLEKTLVKKINADERKREMIEQLSKQLEATSKLSKDSEKRRVALSDRYEKLKQKNANKASSIALISPVVISPFK